MNKKEEISRPAHFKGKDAIGHVVEAQVEGLIASTEVHGTEVPGHITAGADSARETALVLLLLWTVLSFLHIPFREIGLILIIFAMSWALWKCGRSAWLGWSRLERLHRMLEQERWEIEHHRQQERDELRILYAAKGFEGKLLEDVLDVLMADDNRLLQVMVQEELGLSLDSYEHPLKQALGAFFGSIIAAAICLFSFYMYPPFGIILGALLIMGGAGLVLARHAGNHWTPAIVWNIGLAILAFGCTYYLFEYFLGSTL